MELKNLLFLSVDSIRIVDAAVWFHSLCRFLLLLLFNVRIVCVARASIVCYARRLSAFLQMITAIMSVDLSSTCLFGVCTRECVFTRRTGTEIKFPHASFHLSLAPSPVFFYSGKFNLYRMLKALQFQIIFGRRFCHPPTIFKGSSSFFFC